MINEIGKIYAKPWGSYQTLVLEANYQVKKLTFNPQGCLSLQKHFKRSEHWVITLGNSTITLGNTVKVYEPNDYLYIPVEAVHRIENFTDTLVTIIEVQFGSYLGEDDILRLKDAYGRS